VTRGPFAITLTLLLSVMPIRSALADSREPAGSATCWLDTPAPKGSLRLMLRSPSGGEGAAGFWISETAMQRSAARMDKCVTGWSTCEVKLSVEQGKRIKLGWKAWAIGIGSSLAIGFAVGAAMR